MFEEDRIDNDLKKVDDAVREYWDLAPRKIYNPKKQPRRQRK